MGYVAVTGGQEAIEESLNLLEWERVRSGRSVAVKDILAAFPDLIDQVMGESSLYCPDLAALALKQAQGSPEEAVFLLRAFRSTLERPYTSRTVEAENMLVKRRISAAFKDIPGGQILGATRDYSHRLIDFDLRDEDDDAIREVKKRLKRTWKKPVQEQATSVGESACSAAGVADNGVACDGRIDGASGESSVEADAMPKVADYLRREGLLVAHEATDEKPVDVTMEPLVFPASRSARL
ncbi:MAG: carbon-phosphorus lyase complex subunit PhnI, partial [Raoultibacter sp.]